MIIKQFYKYFNNVSLKKLILVDCPKKERMRRLKNKGWTDEKIKNIEKLQRGYKFNRKDFDYIIQTGV